MKKGFNKLFGIICAITMVLTTIIPIAHAENDIRVVMNGKEIQFDVPPQIVDDYTMVPVRAIFEALGYTVKWIPEAQMIVAINQEADRAILMNINITVIVAGSYKELLNEYNNNNKDVTNYFQKNSYLIEKAPVIINERTLVPVRVIAEANGFIVNWEPFTQTVSLNSGGKSSYFSTYSSFYDEAPTLYSFANILDRKEIKKSFDASNGFYTYVYYLTDVEDPSIFAKRYVDYLTNDGYYITPNKNSNNTILINYVNNIIISVSTMTNPNGIIVIFGSPSVLSNSTITEPVNEHNMEIDNEIQKTQQEIKRLKSKIKTIKQEIDNKTTEMNNVAKSSDVRVVMGGRIGQSGDPDKIQQIQNEIDELNVDLRYYEELLDNEQEYLKKLQLSYE